MNILEQIVQDKKAEVSQKLGYIEENLLWKNDSDIRVPLDFKAGLQDNRLSIVAEVKKASPSKGIIREDFNPVWIARSYEAHGAACISVLTEEKYFQGHPDFLKEIRTTVGIPLLRKDFVTDERQIRESYNLGADAILLIVAVLTDNQLSHFSKIARGFGLSCLVEVHTENELETALDNNCDLIGINNRNLTTFKTDLKHSIKIRKRIPPGIVCISESGIHTADDCKLLRDHGFDAVLVGETLMRQPDPGTMIPALLEFSE